MDDAEHTGGVASIQVMTTVYGVTFIGAREQIEKQLKDSPYVPKEDAYMAAAYLAKKVRFFHTHACSYHQPYDDILSLR